MLFSTASPILLWYIGWGELQYPSLRRPTQRAVFMAANWWLITTGFDALAGYTFARVAQNQGNYTISRVTMSLIYVIGHTYIHPASGAASIGVFGALTILWPFLSFLPFGSCIIPAILFHVFHALGRAERGEEIGNPSYSGNEEGELNNYHLPTLRSSQRAMPSRSSPLTPLHATPIARVDSMRRAWIDSTRHAWVVSTPLSGTTVWEDESLTSKAQSRNHVSTRSQHRQLIEPLSVVYELPTDPPEHNPKPLERLGAPSPVAAETFLQDLAEFLSHEPNYYSTTR